MSVSVRAGRWLAAGLALASPTAPAAAAIIGTCSIVINVDGLMTPDPAIGTLGSGQAGGHRATATVTASSLICSILNLLDCYSISAPAPTSFLSAPSGGGAGVSFATLFRIGAGPDLPGNMPAKLVNGSHMISVDLTATRSAGVFPAGSYQAEVVLRCE